MGREPQEATIAGLRVTSQPLPFSQAEPLLPDVGTFLALVLEEVAKALEGVDVKSLLATLKGGKLDIAKLDIVAAGLKPGKFAAAIRTAFLHLGEGKLSRLAPKIMATTCVDAPDMSGEMQRRELGKPKDRELVFDEHPEAYLPILWFAGRCTFARYFPGAGLTAGETPSESS